MARLGKRASGMPAMTSTLPEALTYHYPPGARLHSARIGERMPEPPHPLTGESRHVTASKEIDPCWMGYCNKCGRTLVSAITPTRVRPDRYACGICE